MEQTAIKGAASQVSRAMRAVTLYIRAEQLRVGDSLPGEAHFADQLHVSRAVMREAFGALAALKVLDVGNGRRARVGAIDGSVFATSLDHGINTAQISLPDVWEVRQTIEHRTAMLAAVNRTPPQAAEIVRLAEMLALEKNDLDQITRDDIALHNAVAIASHNSLYVQIVASFGPLMEVAVPAAWRTRRTEAERAAMVGHHRALARAIADMDEEAAGAAMTRHFDTSIGDVMKAMAERQAIPLAQ